MPVIGWVCTSFFFFFFFFIVDDNIRPNGPFEKSGPLDDN